MNTQPIIAVIGAGPAGLMAAEQICAAGMQAHVFDAMPTPARKFLRAGIGGLNLTHSEPLNDFIARYGARAGIFAPWLHDFGPAQQRQWAQELGIETFVGSSGRVFPVGFKAAPMLRAWLRRLAAQGAVLHNRHRWIGWAKDGALRFHTPTGEVNISAHATILALGGASWPQLGSNAAWTETIASLGVTLAPWRPSNCGFDVTWGDHFRQRFAGHPVKSVGVSIQTSDDIRCLKGEFVITATGVEGSAIYALSAPLRDAGSGAALLLDLKPDWPNEKLGAALAKPRGSRSLSHHLERCAGLKGVHAGLLRELGGTLPTDPTALAALIKALPLPIQSPRPVAEAISCAGGVRFEELTPDLMLKTQPGLFFAGEMLDWEAPTGGYLLTGCLATGRIAGLATTKWINRQ